MIKHVLTFVSDLHGYVLVDFIRQNIVKILHKIKICQNTFHQKFPNPNPHNNKKKVHFFEFLSCC